MKRLKKKNKWVNLIRFFFRIQKCIEMDFHFSFFFGYAISMCRILIDSFHFRTLFFSLNKFNSNKNVPNRMLNWRDVEIRWNRFKIVSEDQRWWSKNRWDKFDRIEKQIDSKFFLIINSFSINHQYNHSMEKIWIP